MKLTHPEWNHQIVLKDGKVSILVVENPMLMFEWVNDLYNQCNCGLHGRFVLSSENEEIAFDKSTYIVLNPFELDINNRKILTKLYSELKGLAVCEQLYIETNEIISNIQRYLERISEESDFSLEYNQEIDMTGIFKLFDLKLQKESSSLLEHVVDYMEIMQKIFHFNICILVNMKSYLTKDELKQLYSMSCYRKINIIMIEGKQPEDVSEEEEVFIIDKMGCEIYGF